MPTARPNIRSPPPSSRRSRSPLQRYHTFHGAFPNTAAKSPGLARSDTTRSAGRSGPLSSAGKKGQQDLSSGSDDDDTPFAATHSVRELPPSQAERSGYLEKRGKRNPDWRSRWFVLHGTRLYYHKSHEHPQPVDFIPIEFAHIRPAASPSATAGNSSGKEGKLAGMGSGDEFLLEIDTVSRLYQLRAKSAQDMVSSRLSSCFLYFRSVPCAPLSPTTSQPQ